MSLLLIYLLVVFAFAIVSYAYLSHGSLFNEKGEVITTLFATLVLIVMCILSSIWYSWFHIFGLIGTAYVSALFFNVIWKSTIFKNRW